MVLAAMPQTENRLSALESAVEDIKRDLKGIKRDLKRIEEKSLPFAWKAIPLIAVLITIGLSFYVYQYSPKDIDSHVAPVEKKVDVLTQHVDDQIIAINRRVDGVEKRIEGLDQKIDKIMEMLTVNPRRVRSSLERALPKEQGKSKASFQVAQELLKHAEQKGVVLNPQDLKELALPLLKVQYGNDEAKLGAWATAKEFAAYRTTVNKIQFGVPDPSAKRADNYFDGGVQNLGSRMVWKDTVFINCQIDIPDAQAKLILDNVRFINCDFHLLDDTDAGKKLVEALLSSSGPAVSATILDHPIPAGVDKS
jgi:hypothetical protein